VDKEIVSEEKDKPVLDQLMLGKLLEAAYVLQEHNREVREMERGLSLKSDQLEEEERSASPPATPQKKETGSAATADYTLTLAKIVETQHQIQVRRLELESAMSLVAERLVPMARAGGAAIGILDGKKLHFRAVSGMMTLPAGTSIAMEKALCLACLRTGHVFRCADVNPEFLLDTEECLRRGIQSLIAVPIFHEGGVAGGLELYYPTTQAFTEQDVHTCQLMAGLVTEALARAEEVTWKKSLATERAVMLEALEKLQPNLAALLDKSSAKGSAAGSGGPTIAASSSASLSPSASVSASSSAPASTSVSTFLCRKCGHSLVGEEQFCGNCGTPRSSDYEAPSMQSKVASLWQMQEAMKKSSPVDAATHAPAHPGSPASPGEVPPEKSLADTLEEEMPELFAAAGLPVHKTTRPAEPKETPDRTPDRTPISAEFEDSVLADLEIPEKPGAENELKATPSTALTKTNRTAWSSAASAREFLEQLAVTERPGALARFWNARRGDIYLAIAVILVAVVIRWGMLSNHPVSATGSPAAAGTVHRKAAPEADLSLFDRMLISLGLAEAPPAPEYKGNPNTQVWVDLQTALYYCPGADLYGKTAKGKYSSQREAQLDQFEPAYRKSCD